MPGVIVYVLLVPVYGGVLARAPGIDDSVGPPREVHFLIFQTFPIQVRFLQDVLMDNTSHTSSVTLGPFAGLRHPVLILVSVVVLAWPVRPCWLHDQRQAPPAFPWWPA